MYSSPLSLNSVTVQGLMRFNRIAMLRVVTIFVSDVHETLDFERLTKASKGLLTDLRQTIEHQFICNTHDVHDKLGEVIDALGDHLVEQVVTHVAVQVSMHIVK